MSSPDRSLRLARCLIIPIQKKKTSDAGLLFRQEAKVTVIRKCVQGQLAAGQLAAIFSAQKSLGSYFAVLMRRS